MAFAFEAGTDAGGGFFHAGVAGDGCGGEGAQDVGLRSAWGGEFGVWTELVAESGMGVSCSGAEFGCHRGELRFERSAFDDAEDCLLDSLGWLTRYERCNLVVEYFTFRGTTTIVLLDGLT